MISKFRTHEFIIKKLNFLNMLSNYKVIFDIFRVILTLFFCVYFLKIFMSSSSGLYSLIISNLFTLSLKSNCKMTQPADFVNN